MADPLPPSNDPASTVGNRPTRRSGTAFPHHRCSFPPGTATAGAPRAARAAARAGVDPPGTGAAPAAPRRARRRPGRGRCYGLFKWGFLLLKFGKLERHLHQLRPVAAHLHRPLRLAVRSRRPPAHRRPRERPHALRARRSASRSPPRSSSFGFGAVVTTKGFRDARQEAIVAIGGPVVGTARGAALLPLRAVAARRAHRATSSWRSPTGAASSTSSTSSPCRRSTAAAWPARCRSGPTSRASASCWCCIAGYTATGAPLNPFLVIILLFGIFSTVGRFRRARAGQEPPPLPPHVRLAIGVAYVAMLVVSAGRACRLRTAPCSRTVSVSRSSERASGGRRCGAAGSWHCGKGNVIEL